ncbi:AraC family transcriptional regulator [Streptodolium elevatio]|uniref:AraC family transcriptional regulator n=1 Tax=Streptodolium elevatio TaxID=3157996 RepID=A0ABV3DQ86_9ACTN
MRYHDWAVHDTQSWSSLINALVPMDQRYRGSPAWSAELTIQESESYRLLRFVQNGERTARRTPSQIRRDPGDAHYWVLVPRSGGYSIRQDDRQTVVMPGLASIMLLGETCSMYFPTADCYGFQIPRAALDGRIRVDRPLRRTLDLRSGLGHVVRDMMRSAHSQGAALSGPEFGAVCDRIAELLCMLATGDTKPAQGHLDEIATVVRRYVREHVGHRDLHLSAVARALGWSPRQLRLALQGAGTTFRDVRQEESLRLARDLLADTRPDPTPIGEIAARVGLTPTWFSAAFKARYGETPRNFRARMGAEPRQRQRTRRLKARLRHPITRPGPRNARLKVVS